MKQLFLFIASLLAYDTYAQPASFTHAKELGINGQPKTITLQSFEARKTAEGKYEKAAKFPYHKQITRFNEKGNIINSVDYTFSSINLPNADTIDIARTEYSYTNTVCTRITIYANDVKYLQYHRSWNTANQYTDSCYAFTGSDSAGKLVAVKEVILKQDYTIQSTKRTEYYKAIRSTDNNGKLHLRENNPPFITDTPATDDYVFSTKDDKQNITAAYYETGYSTIKDYLLEEYSYTYY